MAGEGAVVGKNDRVADHAIVTDVRVGEEISATADARADGLERATINGHELSEIFVIPKLEVGLLSAVFQVLSLLADGAVSVEFVSPPGTQWPGQRDVVLQPAIFA